MRYGKFINNGNEYLITTPHTPRDWYNILWNPTYLACVSQNLNGFSLYQSEKGVVTNQFGKQDQRSAPRNIYLRDKKSKEVWSVAFQPTTKELDEYKCSNGLGYTKLESKKNGIKVSVTIFVPRKESAEIWSLEILNKSSEKREISVFTMSEVMLDGVNMTYGYLSSIDGYCDISNKRLFYRNRANNVVNEKYRAFSYSDIPFNNYDISKEHFWGKNKNYVNPESIIKGKLNNSNASAEYMVSAFQYDLKLKPNDKKRINIILGIVSDEKEADKIIKTFSKSSLIDSELDSIKKENIKKLDLNKLETPDKNFNNLFNFWLKHQLYLMADWARFYFKGFRDTLQDAAGMAIHNPQRALLMLEKALTHQKKNGFCPRAFRVPSMDVASADKHYSDSPTWISHTTDSILRETGDLSILNSVVPYSDGGEGSIWEHNLKALDFLWNDRGENGLSLIRHGDWNDLMDKVGAKCRGEGIWISMAFARALKIISKIANWKGDKKTEDLCKSRFEELKQSILKYGFEDDHFIYAISDSGKKIGSSKSKEGKYYLNPQSWALLSDVIDSKDYKKIMQKVEPKLETEVGPMHHFPPYTKYDSDIGQLTSTPQGFFTNGNVYSHAATFKIAADYKVGRNDKAFQMFKKILPSEEKSEPYAQSNGYVGPTALRKIKNVSDDPWRTGAVAWNMLNCFDHLLGFKRDINGFYLDPQIPSGWNKLTYNRFFRGTNYSIEIKRGKNKKIIVDGIVQSENYIDVPSEGLKKKSVKIKIIL